MSNVVGGSSCKSSVVSGFYGECVGGVSLDIVGFFLVVIGICLIDVLWLFMFVDKCYWGFDEFE